MGPALSPQAREGFTPARSRSRRFVFCELAQDDVALQRRDVVDEERAFEVIHLVLDAGGQQPFGLQLADLVLRRPGSAPASRPDGSHRRSARAATGSPRYRPASSSESQKISGLAILWAGRLLGFGAIDHDDALQHADLRRRKADARRLVHGFQHVVHQPAYRRRLSPPAWPLSEARIGRDDDGRNAITGLQVRRGTQIVNLLAMSQPLRLNSDYGNDSHRPVHSCLPCHYFRSCLRFLPGAGLGPA